MNPPVQSHWFLIGFAVCIVFGNSVASVRTYLRSRSTVRDQNDGSRPRRFARLPRRPSGGGRGDFRFQIFLVAVLLFGFSQGPWRLEEVGYRVGTSPLLAIATGLALYGASCLAFTTGVRLLGRVDEEEDASFLAIRSIWPRSRSEKPFAFISCCMINPCTEEILYRGILVYALGEAIGNFTIPVIAGLLLNLATHFYQGPANLIFHSFFFAACVSILFSPLGLLGAVSFHFAGDLVPVVTFRHQMDRWVMRRRAARKQADQHEHKR